MFWFSAFGKFQIPDELLMKMRFDEPFTENMHFVNWLNEQEDKAQAKIEQF